MRTLLTIALLLVGTNAMALETSEYMRQQQHRDYNNQQQQNHNQLIRTLENMNNNLPNYNY